MAVSRGRPDQTSPGAILLAGRCRRRRLCCPRVMGVGDWRGVVRGRQWAGRAHIGAFRSCIITDVFRGWIVQRLLFTIVSRMSVDLPHSPRHNSQQTYVDTTQAGNRAPNKESHWPAAADCVYSRAQAVVSVIHRNG